MNNEGRKLLDLFPKRNYCDGSADGCLDVRLTNKCDSACSFCIAAEDMKVARKMDLDAMIASTKLTDSTSVSIIGGEPLLFLDKLLSYIERVKEEVPAIKDFYITTALPYTLVSQRSKFDELMEEHVTVLNCSVQHFDSDRNNLILNPKRKFNRLKVLEDILKVSGNPEKIRVHLNLSKSGIATAEELNAALYFLREMGVQDVKVNELMNAPEEYVSFEEITGLELESPYYHGCSTSIDYFPGISTTLKRSCFVVEESRSATKLDLLKLEAKVEFPELQKDPSRMRILYEDGELSDHWLDGQPV